MGTKHNTASWLKTAIIVLSALGFCACSTHTDSSLQLRSQLKKMLDYVVSEYNAPGASIAIKFLDNSVFQHSTGVADTQSGEPLTIQDYFRIGSVSKTFTAKAALLLYQEGLYDLDDSVESLLPDLTEFTPLHGKGITVRMLLDHTSGLEDYVELPFEQRELFYELIDDPLRPWLPEELVAISVKNGLVSVPGEKFNYSNTNYILLGLIIEKLSGQSYETFVKVRLIDALGLKHTLVPDTTGLPDDYAHGYFEKNSDTILYDYSEQSPTSVWSAGNIISTAPDLLVWLESLIKGELLTPKVKKEQFNFQISDDFGYGLGVASMGNALGHNGSIFGYQTQMFECKGVYFVIYTNCYYLTHDNVSQIIFKRAEEIIFGE